MRFDLSARLVWLAAAGLAAGAGAAWIVSMAGPGRPSVPDVPLAVPVAILVGWSFIGSGLLSWQPGQPVELPEPTPSDWWTELNDASVTSPWRPIRRALGGAGA